jgi:signal transduction histidine kinase
MLMRGTLRRRFAVVLVALTAAAAAVQGIGYWAAESWVQTTSLERLLDHELGHLVRIDATSADELPETELVDTSVRYYRSNHGQSPPAELASLKPGWYPTVAFQGRDYQVLVRDLGPGDRAWLLHEASSVEGRDHILVRLLSLGVLLVTAMALWVSGGLAARALIPLNSLVAEIRALNPEAPGARLKLEETGELRVIAEAVNAMMAELDGLVERERSFSASASHELRTPLAVIGGAADVLVATQRGVPSAPLARIRRAVEQARLDLDALLTLSRSRGTPPVQKIELHRLLPPWAEPYVAVTSSPPRLEWRLQPHDIEIAADSLRIVFTNLLRNALRAAGAGGLVVIELDGRRLRVIDDGPGIPAEELPHVFEPHISGHHGGTGIGLYIARTLVQRHGWQLTLDNRSDARGAVAELKF